MRARVKAAIACWTAAAAAGCGDADEVRVQPLPPLERPSPEARAGLPELGGVWRFAGFEIPAADTAQVRNRVYAMTPPGDLGVQTQRLDSIAGRYLRPGAAFPFEGEVRRDSTFTLVAFAGGVGSFVAGRVRRDTLWVELTSVPSAESWPRGTRAGLVRRPSGEPFLRLLGGAPIGVPVDTAAPAGTPAAPVTAPPTPAETVPPGVDRQPPAPAAAPPRETQPQRPQPRRPAPPERTPEPEEPRRQEPEPEPEPPRREQPPPERPRPQRPPEPDPEPPRPEPAPTGPRDTVRFGFPPR